MRDTLHYKVSSPKDESKVAEDIPHGSRYRGNKSWLYGGAIGAVLIEMCLKRYADRDVLV